MDESQEVSAAEVLSGGCLGQFIVHLPHSVHGPFIGAPFWTGSRNEPSCASCSGQLTRDLVASFLIVEVNYAVGSGPARPSGYITLGKLISERAAAAGRPSNCAPAEMRESADGPRLSRQFAVEPH